MSTRISIYALYVCAYTYIYTYIRTHTVHDENMARQDQQSVRLSLHVSELKQEFAMAEQTLKLKIQQLDEAIAKQVGVFVRM